MEIQTGIPNVDGQYLVFVASDIMPQYARPIVIMRHGDDWFYPQSSVRYRPQVYAWLGPLPVGKLTELFPEFDL